MRSVTTIKAMTSCVSSVKNVPHWKQLDGCSTWCITPLIFPFGKRSICNKLFLWVGALNLACWMVAIIQEPSNFRRFSLSGNLLLCLLSTIWYRVHADLSLGGAGEQLLSIFFLEFHVRYVSLLKSLCFNFCLDLSEISCVVEGHRSP
jgi:hypothetical protein